MTRDDQPRTFHVPAVGGYIVPMPMYEFHCRACDERFEKLIRSFAEAPVAACPKCDSTDTSRELSVFAVGTDGPKPSAAPAGCGRCGGPGPCGM